MESCVEGSELVANRERGEVDEAVCKRLKLREEEDVVSQRHQRHFV